MSEPCGRGALGGTIGPCASSSSSLVVALGIRAFLGVWRQAAPGERSASRAGAERPSRPIPPTSCAASSPSRARTTRRTTVEEPPAASVADRRAEVHEQGRAAVDEMKSSDED